MTADEPGWVPYADPEPIAVPMDEYDREPIVIPNCVRPSIPQEARTAMGSSRCCSRRGRGWFLSPGISPSPIKNSLSALTPSSQLQ